MPQPNLAQFADLFANAEKLLTEALIADAIIPPGWRYRDIPWVPPPVFDLLIEKATGQARDPQVRILATSTTTLRGVAMRRGQIAVSERGAANIVASRAEILAEVVRNAPATAK